MRYRTLAAAAIALLTTACFERPVRETLEIRVLPGGRIAVAATVEIAERLQGEQNARRAATLRGELLREQDVWSRRFIRLEPDDETYRRVHSKGRLVRVERSATIQLRDLDRLFSDTGVSVQTTHDGLTDEIVLHPFASPRATRDQQLEAHRAIEAVSSNLEDYYAAVHELYRFLDSNPHRASAAFAAIFLVDPESERALSPLERSLVGRVDTTLTAAVETMTETVAGMPADELATLVFDPFPAEIRLVAPGVVEQEGFAASGPDAWSIERKSLSGALVSLAGTWARPDPLVLLLTSSEEKTRDLELADVVAVERHSSEPAATTIRGALERTLRPAPLYRLRWTRLP